MLSYSYSCLVQKSKEIHVGSKVTNFPITLSEFPCTNSGDDGIRSCKATGIPYVIVDDAILKVDNHTKLTGRFENR